MRRVFTDLRARLRRRSACGLDFALAFGLVGLVAVIYGQTLGHAFIWFDDRVYVSKNAHVLRGLTWEGVLWAFRSIHEANWHPLTWISHMLDVTLWGDWAGGHHLTNVILHALNSVLVFLVVRGLVSGFPPSPRLRRASRFQVSGSIKRDFLPDTRDLTPDTSPWPAAVVAALFAVHPMHVESVAWVAERKDVLCAFFFLLTLGAYGRYARAGRYRLSVIGYQSEERVAPLITDNRSLITFPRFWYLLTLLLFTLALLAKPMAVTLPFVLLLLDYGWGRFSVSGFRGDAGGPRLRKPETRNLKPIFEKLPFLALSAASCVVTLVAQQGAMSPLEALTPWQRVSNALVGYGFYLWRFFWPVDLCLFYPYEHARGPVWPWLVSGGVLVGISLAAIRWRRAHTGVAVGWFWFVGMLVPVIGLVQVGSQARADRYTYLPYMGLALAVAWLARGWAGAGALPANRLSVGNRRRVLAVLALVAVLACVWLAHRQTRTWRNSVAVFEQVLRVVGPRDIVLATLAGALSEEGRYEEALAHLEVALKMGRDPVEHLSYIAVILKGLGRYEDAAGRARAVLQLNPAHTVAYGILGESLFALGRRAEAIVAYEDGLRRSPATNYLLYGLGRTLLADRRYDEAIARFREALAPDPRNWLQRAVLAEALWQAGHLEDATAELQRATDDLPATSEARRLMALAYQAFADHLEKAGLRTECAQALRMAASLDPEAIEPRRQLLRVLFEPGGAELARVARELERALRRVTGAAGAEARNDLAWVLATHPDREIRDGERAVNLARAAVTAGEARNPGMLDTLAAAYAEAGRFADAVETARRALALTRSEGQATLAAEIESRSALYATGRSYREGAAPTRSP
jgi:tetratricopeptide (TPR) repeat protein